MDKTLQFLKDARVFYVATVDENGKPRVRPFGAAGTFEGKLYICLNNRKPVFKQLTANPSVEISATAADMSWIRFSATAKRDDRVEARQAMLDSNPNLKNLYKADDGLYEVFYLENATAKFNSMAPDAKEEIHTF